MSVVLTGPPKAAWDCSNSELKTTTQTSNWRATPHAPQLSLTHRYILRSGPSGWCFVEGEMAASVGRVRSAWVAAPRAAAGVDDFNRA